MQKILVTGALGQIGSELVVELRKKHGQENVIASDVRVNDNKSFEPFEIIDVLDKHAIREICLKHDINIIHHLAAILSANGEKTLIYAGISI